MKRNRPISDNDDNEEDNNCPANYREGPKEKATERCVGDTIGRQNPIQEDEPSLPNIQNWNSGRVQKN
jgi:hypothetical protein